MSTTHQVSHQPPTPAPPPSQPSTLYRPWDPRSCPVRSRSSISALPSRPLGLSHQHIGIPRVQEGIVASGAGSRAQGRRADGWLLGRWGWYRGFRGGWVRLRAWVVGRFVVRTLLRWRLGEGEGKEVGCWGFVSLVCGMESVKGRGAGKGQTYTSVLCKNRTFIPPARFRSPALRRQQLRSLFPSTSALVFHLLIHITHDPYSFTHKPTHLPSPIHLPPNPLPNPPSQTPIK